MACKQYVEDIYYIDVQKRERVLTSSATVMALMWSAPRERCARDSTGVCSIGVTALWAGTPTARQARRYVRRSHSSTLHRTASEYRYTVGKGTQNGEGRFLLAAGDKINSR